MRRDGIGLLRRWIMWAAVRMASILRGKGGAGWWQDALVAMPLLLLIALPIVILPVIAIAVSTVAFWLLESFVALLVPDEPPVPLPLKT